ncbi:hypothetical protein Y032_0004g1976 [Ancylostoma ceylanicum]|uniref:SCP domain-containing protein n=1 Tax=Ancylostoma ceylanicum TaxID=53326 RepID=A0A016VUR6_9BILA|nr:hypothetical protein Y032_0004g1976 [Ancylostoma ceylanicum]
MGWGIAPPATLMYRMKYTCDAESYAQQYIQSCNTNGLPEYTHPGYKVNTHVLRTLQTSDAGAAQNAMSTWWSQLARFGMRSNMMFYASEFRRGSRNVLSQVTTAPGAPTAAPGAPTAAPGAPTAAPGAPTAAPGAPTAAPGAPTAAPGAPTAAPGAPTAAPGAPTAAPGAPTAAPAPGAPTAAPGAPTAAPGAPTAAPGAPTAAPGAPTAAPGAPTAAPGVTTAAPGPTTAAPGATTAAPTRPPWPKPNCGNPRLTNSLRNLFLNMHNNWRGSVARGQTETSMGWGIAPPATLMYRMKYTCNAESYAQQYIQSCNTNGLPEYTHPGYKVNTHVLRTLQTSNAGAAQNAMSTWWSQLARFGMRSNMMFYASEFRRGGRNVLSWSKMAWWNNKEVGCSVHRCSSFYYVACMYKPGGNNVNQHVYKVGAVCSECPKGQCDGQALCRW